MLWEVKQKEGQSIRDFLSEITIEGFRLMKKLDTVEREKQMVIAFVDGIISQKVAVAVKDLETAYKLVKKEEICHKQTDFFSRKVLTDDDGTNKNKMEDEIRSLRNDLSLIRKQINSLLNLFVYRRTNTSKNINTNGQNNNWQTVKRNN